jgi:hypothetical protein
MRYNLVNLSSYHAILENYYILLWIVLEALSIHQVLSSNAQISNGLPHNLPCLHTMAAYLKKRLIKSLVLVLLVRYTSEIFTF